MRPASPLTRLAVFGVAAGIVLAAPGQPIQVPAADAPPAASAGNVPPMLLRAAATGQSGNPPYTPGSDLSDILTAPAMRAGQIFRNPAVGRNEVVVPDVSNTAVLIGDSQSVPDDSWPRRALAGLGYKVHFCGYGGTGFTAANGKIGNYVDALDRGDWLLPVGTPGLVVVEGGGNDAARGASDAQITANANRLLQSLKTRYPTTRMVMVGTLARGASNGGGRRSQVDGLLAAIAAKQGVAFVSAGDWLTKYNLTQHLADAVHMDAEGRKALGVVLERRLREVGVPGVTAKPAATAQAGTGPKNG